MAGDPLAANFHTVTEHDAVEGDAGAALPSSVPPPRIGGRYVVHGELGRGGMALVYRVTDTVSGRELALKQLSIPASRRGFAQQAAAFEREFHALVQLAHPRIIEVYDFGSDEGGRFYTMELLDGGDLREHAPLPWREACALFYDVCSSLALLHSRQLVHRDVSPRNIRRTRAGSAKLIDFGALVPLGTSAQVVGTAPFVAPEVLHRSTLDARTDLFSLGASLYFALTGRLAYAARAFSNLQEAWKQRPAPPSAAVYDIPAALDALVLSLLSLDPAARPRTAFEVMQKLATLAGLEHDEAADVTRAYLSTPTLVGREDALSALQGQIAQALDGRGGSSMIRGPEGVGRSRMLDVCALDAKLAGAVVLRVNAGSADDAPLTLGQALASQLVDALPVLAVRCAEQRQLSATLFDTSASPGTQAAEASQRPALKDLTDRAGDRTAIQSALAGWLMQVAKSHPLVVLIDDLQRVEQASLALLAALSLAASSRRLLLVCTAPSGTPPTAEAFRVIERDSTPLLLAPLDREQTETLLGSVFGDVPKLALVSDRLYAAAGGNPRETFELVQSLVLRKAVRYAAGQWLLPSELALTELPSSAAEACRERVAELSVLARELAELLALASHPRLSRADFGVAVRQQPAAEVDAAITELLAARVLTGDGYAFRLARREWCDALLAELDGAARGARHRALAEVYGHDEHLAVERVQHLLADDSDEVGLDLLTQLLGKTTGDSTGLLSLTKMRAEHVAAILDRALDLAERSGRKARDCHEIRRALFAISVLSDEAHYQRAAPRWFLQLRHDAGLDLYQAISDAASPAERLKRALAQAARRYAATPETERVYSPDVAIRSLVYYVVISIAFGSRTQDSALIASLPAVLEPFAPLSALIHTVWQNAIATRETIVDNLPERAHARWLKVLDALSKVTSAEGSYVAPLRGAVGYGLGLIEARMGMASAEERAQSLDDDPQQRVSAVSLRRIARLHQGAATAAERLRKQGEALALRANVRPMFSSTLSAELLAHALASDMTGLREVAEALRPLAARFPGWQGYLHLADGYFDQTCGRLEAARQAFELGLSVSEPHADDLTRSTGAWPRLESAYLELLVITGCAEQARARGERVLETCAGLGIGLGAFPVRRALALAEAKLGEYEAAGQRLAGVVQELSAFTMRGLELGATYEACTRIAIWRADPAAIERYGRLTAQEYRYGEGSALGARYERLMDEVRGSGVIALPALADFHTKLMTSHVHSSASLRPSAGSTGELLSKDAVSEARRIGDETS